MKWIWMLALIAPMLVGCDPVAAPTNTPPNTPTQRNMPNAVPAEPPPLPAGATVYRTLEDITSLPTRPPETRPRPGLPAKGTCLAVVGILNYVAPNLEPSRRSNVDISVTVNPPGTSAGTFAKNRIHASASLAISHHSQIQAMVGRRVYLQGVINGADTTIIKRNGIPHVTYRIVLNNPWLGPVDQAEKSSP